MEQLTVKTRVDRKTGTRKVVLSGELTIYDAAALRDRVMALLKGAKQLQLDAEAISEVDLAGIQVLVALRRKGDAQGIPVEIMRSSPALTQALQLLALSSNFGLPDESGTR